MTDIHDRLLCSLCQLLIGHVFRLQLPILRVDLFALGLYFQEIPPVELLPSKRLQNGSDDLLHVLRSRTDHFLEFVGIVSQQRFNFIVLVVGTDLRYLIEF